MASEKISAFSTITTIPGGPITVSDVLGIAGYCDDPAAPGTDVNVSFSGAEIVAAGLQDLDSVLATGNAANNDIELNDGGANITFYKRNELNIQNQQPYEIKVRGSYWVNSTATAVSGSVINLSSYLGAHDGHITINSRSTTNGILQLITSTDLQINLPVAPTGAGDVLSAKNVSGDVEWVTPPPQAFQILTDADPIVWDTTLGLSAQVTLGPVIGATRALGAPTGVTDGDFGTLRITQGAAGLKLLTLPANFKVVNNGGGAIVLSTVAGENDILSWVYDGFDFWCTLGSNFT